jgi:hypothetical protein
MRQRREATLEISVANCAAARISCATGTQLVCFLKQCPCLGIETLLKDVQVRIDFTVRCERYGNMVGRS